MRIAVEWMQPKDIRPHADFVARCCEKLGHEVVRFTRPNWLPRGASVILTWGDNQPAAWMDEVLWRRKDKSIRHHVYMEVGWFHDRYRHVQLDHMGTNGLASWAGEQVQHSGHCDLRVPTHSNEVLVVLKMFESKTDSLKSPFFESNIRWMEFLLRNTQLKFRVRPHPRQKGEELAKIRNLCAAHRDRARLGWGTHGNAPSFSFIDDARNACAVAALDSTCATQALELPRPVMLYGKQVCRYPGVVYCLDDDWQKTDKAAQEIQSMGKTSLNAAKIAAVVEMLREKQIPINDPEKCKKRLQEDYGL